MISGTIINLNVYTSYDYDKWRLPISLSSLCLVLMSKFYDGNHYFVSLHCACAYVLRQHDDTDILSIINMLMLAFKHKAPLGTIIASELCMAVNASLVFYVTITQLSQDL